MPAPIAPPLAMLAAGLLLVAAAAIGIRWSGARTAMARRLAGARQVKVGDLSTIAPLPERPVRLSGRIRCQDPIVTRDADRLVALHRDVEVELAGGGWRTIERTRETRGFELWDHEGSVAVDPASAAEPLVAIPHVWEGAAADLNEDFHPALARLRQEGGALGGARAVTRAIAVIDRVLVLAEVRRASDGVLSLVPPPGGYVISSLALDDAMRLLGGPRKRLLLASVGALALGGLVALVGAAWLATQLVGGL
jgi:hypothetical protein